MKDDSFDCTLIAHLRIFLLFYRLLYCLILPENRLFFGIWKVVEIEKLSDPMYVSLYQAFLKTQENYTFYTAPKLDSYLDLETKFEELIRQTLSVKRLEWQEHPEDMDKLVSETLEDFKAAYTQ